MIANKAKIILSTIVIVILIILFGLIYFLSTSKVTFDVDKMLENAQTLYEEGDTENAFYQLQLYCQENSDDSEAWTMLGDFCMRENNTEDAYSYYQKAAKLVSCAEKEVGEADKIKTFNDFKSVESLKIYPTTRYTKDMTLVFSGENLTPKDTVSGKVKGTSATLQEDENYLTTEWFTVDDANKYVYITGDINYAEWQFMDNDGYYSNYFDDSDFRNKAIVNFASEAYSCAEIPQNAIKARVTYYNKDIDTNAGNNGKIFVGYGNSLAGFTAKATQKFEIPDLKEDEYIEYKGGKWTLYSAEEAKKLDWDAVKFANTATVSVEGTLCGTVEINVKELSLKEGNKSYQYGLRYSTKSDIAVCERLGHSRGLDFDYKVGDEWNYGTGNDFDKAYPWCEMKLCNVSVDEYGNEKITLEGDKKFKTDGSNGNVMVRIPKFYTKREVKNGYEYIWISGTQHEGYMVEPVFVDAYGNELDYVYISAYLGAEKDEKIISVAESYPTLMLEYGTTLQYAENNGSGFSEMNFLMCSALQKLFVVETGTIDSSSVFAGDTFMYYYYKVDDAQLSGLAVEDAKKSNTIRLYNNYNTIKLYEGSSIVIFENWNKYKNNNGMQREITKLEVSDEYIDVTFDGKPVNIKKGKTAVSNIPAKTGKTDAIDYCTGTLEGVRGKVSFKYRNIENLYGSALVMLEDDAYIQDGYLNYYTGNGYLNVINAPVSEQDTDLSDYEAVNDTMVIKQMSYDESQPQIMVPTVTGKGATVYGYYGDVWMYKNKGAGTKSYILYGGADDNGRVAGVFQMRAVITDYSDSLGFYSARIMYK